ncbi:hypothetical protein D3C83_318950 [compost metagenome]
MASAFSLPALTSADVEPAEAIIICTWLAASPTTAGPAPLYGTRTMSTPAMDLNSSGPKCDEEALLPDP